MSNFCQFFNCFSNISTMSSIKNFPFLADCMLSLSNYYNPIGNFFDTDNNKLYFVSYNNFDYGEIYLSEVVFDYDNCKAEYTKTTISTLDNFFSQNNEKLNQSLIAPINGIIKGATYYAVNDGNDNVIYKAFVFDKNLNVASYTYNNSDIGLIFNISLKTFVLKDGNIYKIYDINSDSFIDGNEDDYTNEAIFLEGNINNFYKFDGNNLELKSYQIYDTSRLFIIENKKIFYNFMYEEGGYYASIISRFNQGILIEIKDYNYKTVLFNEKLYI